MQLKKKRPISGALAVASGALLGGVTPPAAAIDEDLELDVSFLEYREHKRVRVRELDVSARWFFDADNTFSGTVIMDAITGATPSGVLVEPGTSATSTSASGVAGATGTGGESGSPPSLADIVDRRVAFLLGWDHTYQRNLRLNFGSTFSNEDDYQSYGATGGVAWDLNNKLTTLNGGLGFSYDFVGSTDGGVHKELANIKDDREGEYKDGEKLTLDIGAGITQVLTRESVVKVGISTGVVRGYLSDPYKVVTLLAIMPDGEKRADEYFREKRPGSRHRSSLNVDYNLERENYDVVSFGYRLFWDDWGISSHTFDVRYRHDLRGANYVTLHGRYYTQSAADFYKPYLEPDENPVTGSDAPSHVSADQRLNEMQSYTAGLKYGTSGSLGNFFIRYEILRQLAASGDYRTLNAQILQAVWTLDIEKR